MGFLGKNPALAREAFIARYEHGHVPLITEILGSTFAAYSRCYPTAAIDLGFDALTQVWYAAERERDRSLQLHGKPENGRRIAADEAETFDRKSLFFYGVEERGTHMEQVRRDDVAAVCVSPLSPIAHGAFVAVIEDSVVPLLFNGTIESRIVAVRRNYAVIDSVFQNSLYDRQTRMPPCLVTELWFRTESGLHQWTDFSRRQMISLEPGQNVSLEECLGQPIEVLHYGSIAPP